MYVRKARKHLLCVLIATYLSSSIFVTTKEQVLASSGEGTQQELTGSKKEEQTSEAGQSDKVTRTSVYIRWNGGGHLERPAVSVQLYRNGQAESEPITLNESSDWYHVWEELPTGVNWSIDDVETPEGYVKEVIQTIENTYNILYTYDPVGYYESNEIVKKREDARTSEDARVSEDASANEDIRISEANILSAGVQVIDEQEGWPLEATAEATENEDLEEDNQLEDEASKQVARQAARQEAKKAERREDIAPVDMEKMFMNIIVCMTIYKGISVFRRALKKARKIKYRRRFQR